MGITGLIPFLEKATDRINLKDLKGYTMAVDTYCWLHKGAIACADKIARGEDTDIHVKYCLKYVDMLLAHNIKPILVFDGQHLPAKALTEKRRRETRENSKKRAAELLRLGKVDEAYSQLKRCIDIKHEMALQLIIKCRKMNVDCIVAPYEADAQIAYMNKSKIADYVITEDSDLTLFGCKKIIFKLDLAGNGLLIDSDKFHMAMKCRPGKFSFDKFRYMCILSGCDYLDSLPGIGLAKACKFVLMTEETDMRRALLKLPSYLKMKHLTINEEYINGFLKADATFKHMFVYDTFQRRMVRLNELSEFDTNIEYCSNAGTALDEETAFHLAVGNLHPFTLKKLDNWNPDVYFSELRNNKSIRSIWLKDYKVHTPKAKTRDIRCALEYKKINFKSQEDYSEVERLLESEILSLYTPDKPQRKRRRSSSSNSDDSMENIPKTEIQSPKTPVRNNCNPFAKPKSNSPSKSLNGYSLLQKLSPRKTIAENLDDLNKPKKIKQIVKSRLFESNIVLVKSNENNSKYDKKEENTLDNNEPEDTVKEIKKLYDEQQSTSSLCYLSSPEIVKRIIYQKSDSVEDASNEQVFVSSTTDEDQNQNSEDIITDVDIDVGIIEKFSPIKIPESKRKLCLGLSKKKTQNVNKRYQIDKSQSRLSMFGFQKRSSLSHHK